MEFTYEIEIQKALEVAKENVIYGYSFRKQKAKLIFSLNMFNWYCSVGRTRVKNLSVISLYILASVQFDDGVYW
jgi:hypothetical protein